MNTAQLRELRIRTTLGHVVLADELLPLLEDVESAVRETQIADTTEFAEEVDGLRARLDAMAKDRDDWHAAAIERGAKLDEAEKLADAGHRALRLERDLAVAGRRIAELETERNAIAQASQTWTTAKLAAWILDQAETNRRRAEDLERENQMLRERVEQLSAPKRRRRSAGGGA